ncbi:MAG: type III pantothenate kinase [Flavobacteriales bacterium]|nr:MAG: type III pantothenate kinase [Flavobacteriales bacterium]
MPTGPLHLVLDVGNTRVKAALFSGRSVVKHAVLEAAKATDWERWLAGAKPAAIALAASGELPEELMEWGAATAPLFRLTGQSPSLLGTSYATPHTLGTDRWADALAAWQLGAGRPCVAIDLGTCVTYNIVGPDGVFQGGAISPGLHMRARAMHEQTARLPLVEVDAMPPLVGTDTASSLKSGAFHGVLAELWGYTNALRQQWPDLFVVLTGGDALLFTGHLRSSIFADPLLTLRGLHALLEHQLHHGAGPAGAGR